VNKATQTWALITRQGKTFAVPLKWFFVFKRERIGTQTLEDVQRAQDETMRRHAKVDVAFRKKFNLSDEPGVHFSLSLLE
jgi:hypothetical protein